MAMDWVLEWRGLITNCALRDIRNDRNGRETPGKYSVQIQKIQNQMVHPIRSERIPLENISFKIGIFIDWEVV